MTAAGAEIGIEFTGMVVEASPVFGMSEPLFGPVTGRMVYELTSPPSHDPGECSCLGYRQQIHRGFTLAISGFTFSASDYVVQITDDDQNGADILNVLFSSDLSPPPEQPLMVGPDPHATGYLGLVFSDPSGEAFSDASLPLTIDPAKFKQPGLFAFVRDKPFGPSGEIVMFITSFRPLLAVAGDYDLDEDVDGADFLLWQRDFGSMSALAADGSRNKIVDSPDLNVWREHFGNGTASTSYAVPEPISLWLIGIGVAVCRKMLGRTFKTR